MSDLSLRTPLQSCLRQRPECGSLSALRTVTWLLFAFVSVFMELLLFLDLVKRVFSLGWNLALKEKTLQGDKNHWTSEVRVLNPPQPSNGSFLNVVAGLPRPRPPQGLAPGSWHFLDHLEDYHPEEGISSATSDSISTSVLLSCPYLLWYQHATRPWAHLSWFHLNDALVSPGTQRGSEICQCLITLLCLCISSPSSEEKRAYQVLPSSPHTAQRAGAHGCGCIVVPCHIPWAQLKYPPGRAWCPRQ